MGLRDRKFEEESLYFKIAGIASLVLLIGSFLFGAWSPISFPLLLFFSFGIFGSIILSAVSIVSTFYILKGLSIMTERENFYNLKKFAKIFFVLILIVSAVDVFFPYWNASSGIHGFAVIKISEPQNLTTIPYGDDVLNPSPIYPTWVLSGLEIFVFVLYMILGLWILKLRKRFGLLMILASLMYIYPGAMRLLFLLIGFIFPGMGSTSLGFFMSLPFSLLLIIIKIGSHICLSILFFRLSKINKPELKRGRKENAI